MAARFTEYRDQVVFRVRPNPTRRHYYIVRIFKTRRAACAWHRSEHFAPFGSRTRGCCHSYKRYRRTGPVLRELGEIHLLRGYLGTSVVTHESVHAGVGYLHRLGVPFAVRPWSKDSRPTRHTIAQPMGFDSPEEQLCRAVHEVARQIVDVLYRLPNLAWWQR